MTNTRTDLIERVTAQAAALDRFSFDCAVLNASVDLANTESAVVDLQPGDATRYRLIVTAVGPDYIVTPFNTWGKWGWWNGQPIDTATALHLFVIGVSETDYYAAAVYARFLTALAERL